MWEAKKNEEINSLKNELNQEYERKVQEIEKYRPGNSPTIPNKEPSINLEEVVKTIVNDTFQSLRDLLQMDKEYNGKEVLLMVKKVMVEKTIGAVGAVQKNLIRNKLIRLTIK